MSRLASIALLVLVGCARTPAQPTILANTRTAEPAPLEPFGLGGEPTREIRVGMGARTIIERVTWTFDWSRDRQTFVSRAPVVTHIDASRCDVCDG